MKENLVQKVIDYLTSHPPSSGTFNETEYTMLVTAHHAAIIIAVLKEEKEHNPMTGLITASGEGYVQAIKKIIGGDFSSDGQIVFLIRRLMDTAFHSFNISETGPRKGDLPAFQK